MSSRWESMYSYCLTRKSTTLPAAASSRVRVSSSGKGALFHLTCLRWAKGLVSRGRSTGILRSRTRVRPKPRRACRSFRLRNIVSPERRDRRGLMVPAGVSMPARSRTLKMVRYSRRLVPARPILALLQAVVGTMIAGIGVRMPLFVRKRPSFGRVHFAVAGCGSKCPGPIFLGDGPGTCVCFSFCGGVPYAASSSAASACMSSMEVGYSVFSTPSP